MPSNYPDALDSLSNPASGDPLVLPSHASQHTNANDAIEAIQAAIGVSPPRITKSDTEPDSPSQGDIWVDTSAGITKMHSGTEWIGIAYSPENAEPGQVLRVNADNDGYEFASAGIWRPLEKVTVPIGSPVSEMGFSDLAATPYVDYRVRGYFRRAPLGLTSNGHLMLTINGDTTAGAYDQGTLDQGSGASSTNNSMFQLTREAFATNDSNMFDIQIEILRRKYVHIRYFAVDGEENSSFVVGGGGWNNTADDIDELTFLFGSSPAEMYGEVHLEGRLP